MASRTGGTDPADRRWRRPCPADGHGAHPRRRAQRFADAPFYSVRDAGQVLYQAELTRRIETQQHLDVAVHFTRTGPERSTARTGRITAADVAAVAFGADAHPTCYVCGPTPFVETISDLLVASGHPSERVRAERFGPTGG